MYFSIWKLNILNTSKVCHIVVENNDGFLLSFYTTGEKAVDTMSGLTGLVYIFT